MKLQPPIHKVGRENSSGGIVFKADLTNEYIMYSQILDKVLTKHDLENILKMEKLSNELKIITFKCYIECCILYVDPMSQVINLLELLDDVLNNAKIKDYDVEEPLNKTLVRLLDIINYKFISVTTFEGDAPTILEDLQMLEKTFEVVFKSTFKKVFNTYYTKDKKEINIEEGDIIQLIGWEENQSNYDWTIGNTNEDVRIVLKFIP